MARRNLYVVLLPGCMALAILGCGGGGGGGGGSGGGFAARVSLADLSFPDPSDQSQGSDERLPDNAPLIQRIVLTFSDRVDPEQVTSSGIELRDAETRAQVAVDFEVDGARVVVHPTLPIRPIEDLGGDHWDLGGAGLAPHTIYELTVPLAAAGSMPSLVGIAPDLFVRHDYEAPTPNGMIGRNYAEGTRAGTFSVRFRTTANDKRFLSGYEPEVPALVSLVPLDGSERVSPKLLSDPEHRFPEFFPYRLVFDRPLDPALDNVGDDTFELIGLADENGAPPSYPRLGVNVRIIDNRFDRCEVEVVPSGVLPFGHRLGLRVARALRQISGGSSGDRGWDVVSEFTVAGAGKKRVLHDALRETFASSARQETSTAELDGRTLANWDRNDSDYVQSAFGFAGGGELGPFLPLAPQHGVHTMILDTNQQGFPLLDGSTPGAPAGLVVYGGVFNFTDIIIPNGVVITAIGRNPLVFTATGSVSIAGVIDVGGRDGTFDNSYNSALFPIGGGVGGPAAGRGGESHPTIVEGPFQYMNFLPPRIARPGEGPMVKNGGLVFDWIGGGAGECGINASPPLDCGTQTGNKGHGAGGGGGSFLVRGSPGVDGIGDRTSAQHFDNTHKPIFIETQGTLGGAPGREVFFDHDADNDFIGEQGEVALPMGGQGGGGAGSRLDSFFCTLKNWPATTTDSRGGGGGGGGGALVIRALGPITMFTETSQLLAVGGGGGVGEPIGCGGYGGGGGGGAGGLIVLDSATMVKLDDTNDANDDSCGDSCPPGCDIDLSVDGGEGGYLGCNKCMVLRSKTRAGAGGKGGAGLVQLMVPLGLTPDIGPAAFVHPKLPTGKSVLRTPPSQITPISVAQSTWIDVGQIITRGGASPTWHFAGTDPNTGFVVTDADGHVENPDASFIRVDMLPVLDPVTGEELLEGEGDFIPPDASVRVEFQAGDAVVQGAKEVAESSLTPWSPSIAVASGKQFVRYRVTFNIADIAKNPAAQLTPASRLSTVRLIKLPFDF